MHKRGKCRRGYTETLEKGRQTTSAFHNSLKFLPNPNLWRTKLSSCKLTPEFDTSTGNHVCLCSLRPGHRREYPTCLLSWEASLWCAGIVTTTQAREKEVALVYMSTKIGALYSPQGSRSVIPTLSLYVQVLDLFISQDCWNIYYVLFQSCPVGMLQKQLSLQQTGWVDLWRPLQCSCLSALCRLKSHLQLLHCFYIKSYQDMKCLSMLQVNFVDNTFLNTRVMPPKWHWINIFIYVLQPRHSRCVTIWTDTEPESMLLKVAILLLHQVCWKPTCPTFPTFPIMPIAVLSSLCAIIYTKKQILLFVTVCNMSVKCDKSQHGG